MNDANEKILDFLGIDGENIERIVIHMRPGRLPKVTIKKIVTGDILKKEIKRGTLTLVDD